MDAIENQQVVELPEKEGTEGENGAQSPASAAKRRFSPALIAGAAAAAVLLAVGVGYLAGGGGRPGSGHLGGSTGGAARRPGGLGGAQMEASQMEAVRRLEAQLVRRAAGSADAGDAAGEAFSGAEAPRCALRGRSTAPQKRSWIWRAPGLTDADLLSLKKMTSLTFLSLKDNPQITDLSPWPDLPA